MFKILLKLSNTGSGVNRPGVDEEIAGRGRDIYLGEKGEEGKRGKLKIR
jgi:hypothetical protein